MSQCKLHVYVPLCYVVLNSRSSLDLDTALCISLYQISDRSQPTPDAEKFYHTFSCPKSYLFQYLIY